MVLILRLLTESNNNTVTNNTTVNPNVPAPIISNAVANSNGTVTLTGSRRLQRGCLGWRPERGWNRKPRAAPALGPSRPRNLLPGAYGFSATDETAAGGTSAPSSPVAATVSANPSVAAPVISKIAVNSKDSVTLTGTAAGGSTVTVWSTTGDNDGTVTASGSGAWSFTTPDLLPGIYGYTATDTTAAGIIERSV